MEAFACKNCLDEHPLGLLLCQLNGNPILPGSDKNFLSQNYYVIIGFVKEEDCLYSVLWRWPQLSGNTFSISVFQPLESLSQYFSKLFSLEGFLLNNYMDLEWSDFVLFIRKFPDFSSLAICVGFWQVL